MLPSRALPNKASIHAQPVGGKKTKMKTKKQTCDSQLGKTEKERKQTNKHMHLDLLERYLMKPWFMVIGQ